MRNSSCVMSIPTRADATLCESAISWQDATVVVYESELSNASCTADSLRADFPEVQFLASSPIAVQPTLSGADVHLVNVTTLDPAMIGEIVGRRLMSGETTVYWADAALAPQVCAARALGVARIVPKSHLREWLRDALVPLLCEARGRRLLQAAHDNMPPLPAWSSPDTCPRLSLAQAETMFRETYVAALLAEGGSSRRAAEMARVPYRTFYDMLKKLSLPRRL